MVSSDQLEEDEPIHPINVFIYKIHFIFYLDCWPDAEEVSVITIVELHSNTSEDPASYIWITTDQFLVCWFLWSDFVQIKLKDKINQKNLLIVSSTFQVQSRSCWRDDQIRRDQNVLSFGYLLKSIQIIYEGKNVPKHPNSSRCLMFLQAERVITWRGWSWYPLLSLFTTEERQKEESQSYFKRLFSNILTHKLRFLSRKSSHDIPHVHIFLPLRFFLQLHIQFHMCVNETCVILWCVSLKPGCFDTYLPSFRLKMIFMKKNWTSESTFIWPERYQMFHWNWFISFFCIKKSH